MGIAEGDELRSPPSMAETPSAASPTPFTPSSLTDKKSVLLSDWWLVRVEEGFQGKNLAVSGFTMRQQATRIFCSAPIIKRYDAYTLESADGITITIQGMINKDRSHDNGFPLEVCSRFLIGFPYNWDHYADECYSKESHTTDTNTSRYSFQKADSRSPVQLDEFPLGKFVSFLTSTRDTLTTNFGDNLKKFFKCTSVDYQLHKPSSSSIENLTKCSMDKRHQNIYDSAALAEHDAEDHVVDHHQEVGYHVNDLHVHDDIIGSKIDTDVLYDSSSHPSRKNGNHQAIAPGMQEETPSVSIPEAGMSNSLMVSTSKDHYDIDILPASTEGKLSAEDCIATCNLETNNVSSTTRLKGSDVSVHSHGKGPANAELQLHVEDSQVPRVDITHDSIFLRSLGMQDANFLMGKSNIGNESCLSLAVTESLKNSIQQKEDGVPRSAILSQDKPMLSSSLSLSREEVDSSHVEGNIRGLDEDNKSKDNAIEHLEESSLNETNDMCDSIAGKITKFNIASAGVSGDETCPAADIERTSASDEVCMQKETLVRCVKKQKQKGASVQKEGQKCLDCINLNMCMHLSSTEEPPDGEGLAGIFTSFKSEGLLSTDTDVCSRFESGICTRSGLKLRLPSGSKLSYHKKLCSSKLEYVDFPDNSKVSPSVSLINSYKKQVESSVEIKNNVKPISVNRKAVSSTNDVSSGSTCNTSQDKPTPEFRKGASKLFQDGVDTCPWKTRVKLSKNYVVKRSPQYSVNRKVQIDTSFNEFNDRDYLPNIIDRKFLEKSKGQKKKETEVVEAETPPTTKEQSSRRRKVSRQISLINQSPLTRDRAKKLSMASPESLNLRRSRSGRLLVPPLDSGCQQIVYDMDGLITGIMGIGVTSTPKGSKSEPAKKRRKFV